MKLTQPILIFLVSLFLTVFGNIVFFKEVLKVFPFQSSTWFLFSVFCVLLFFISLIFTLISSRWTTKPVLILILLISSSVSYFMQTYSVIIDSTMIQNSMQTNFGEAFDLLTWSLVGYFVVLGVLPSYLVYKADVVYGGFKKELVLKLKALGFYIVVIVVLLFSFSKYYTSFFREHKPLRFYTNPTYYMYSFGKYVSETFSTNDMTLKSTGQDAKQRSRDKKRVVIMIVGEALRADRISLNGYQKETSPLLKKQNIINLSNLYSCGTTTAISVPCMFSIYDRGDYSYKKGKYTENVIDVLSHTNTIDLLWRDNNSDSKGVATRIDYEDYRSPSINTICDIECRDEGMLVGLEDIVEKSDNDVFIVLHQMGNHGPAYFKRYPKEFEKFVPVCSTNQIEKCTVEEISNAYDNTVLYTDYFLDKSIKFLKNYDDRFDTALIYMSDHGESLGENGLYLHGMPYLIAPDHQKHVAGFIWLGDGLRSKVDTETLMRVKDKEYSHDNLFHTILGVMGVTTEVYDKDLDILKVVD
jgi:lipid A ethanolaminephosphotransferase